MIKWRIDENDILELIVGSGSGGGTFIRFDDKDRSYPWCVYEWSDGCDPQFQDRFNSVKSAIEYTEGLS